MQVYFLPFYFSAHTPARQLINNQLTLKQTATRPATFQIYSKQFNAHKPLILWGLERFFAIRNRLLCPAELPEYKRLTATASYHSARAIDNHAEIRFSGGIRGNRFRHGGSRF